MSDPVRAALIALCGGVAVAMLNSAYNVGGRSALQRRVLKQELELLALLEGGPLREELQAVLQRRMTLYLVRLLPESSEVRSKRSFRATFLSAMAVLMLSISGAQVGSSKSDQFPSTFSAWTLLTVTSVFFFAAAVVDSSALFAWVRNARLERQLRRYRGAEQRFSQVRPVRPPTPDSQDDF